MGEVKIEGLTIHYDGILVVNNLCLEINNGEIMSLLGPSGAGKTTILKAIAGLIKPESGRIYLNKKRVDHLTAENREAVLVFQKPLLFPFLNVIENIGFGLKMAKTDKQLAHQKIERIIKITELSGLEHRRIHQLSGGQQQRVALARGLVLEPSVLLLDEPLSSLDPELRQQMQGLIKEVQTHTGTTMLFVTHNQSEAFGLSDRVCLLLDGEVHQIGRPQELFYQPASLKVARFMGCTNFIRGNLENNWFTNSFLRFSVATEGSGEVTASIRSEDIAISHTKGKNGVSGEIVSQLFEGTTTKLQVQVGKEIFQVTSLRPDFQVGQNVWLSLPAKHFRLFPTRRTDK